VKFLDCIISLQSSKRKFVALSKTNVVLAFVIPVWFLTALIGLFFSSKSIEKPFDPSGTLYYAANKPDFDKKVHRILDNALDTSLHNVVVHIASNSGCLCQRSATRHIKSIKDKVESIDKRNISVYIENIDALSVFLTSTPAIAVFDEDSQLSYFGPYSTGIGCLTGNGTVEPYLDTKSTLGAIVPLESTGCYCDVRS